MLIGLGLLGVLVPAQRAAAAQCGLPDSKPLWIDYAEGSVGFRDAVFARPGIVAATSGTAVPQALRNGGARTVYWNMKLGALVGTTTAPADPATIAAAAQKLFDAAAASSGCSTPLIALNELNGASTTTPWTTTNSRYRQNVLDLLRSSPEPRGEAVSARQLVPLHGRRCGRTGGGRRRRWPTSSPRSTSTLPLS